MANLLAGLVNPCAGCPLANCKQVGNRGPEDAGVVIVGRDPGQEEVARGQAFVGPSGKELVAALQAADFDPRDILFTNAVRCWDGADKPPVTLIDRCRANLEQVLHAHPRRLIITLGNEACYTLLGGKVGGVLKRHGQIHRSEEFDADVFVSLHPSYILRNPSARAYWIEQFQRAKAHLDGGLDVLDDYELEYTTPSAYAGDRPTVFDLLTDDHWALQADRLAVDIESTSKIYWDGELLGVGLSTESRALYICVRHGLQALEPGSPLALSPEQTVTVGADELDHLLRWLHRVVGPDRQTDRELVLHNGKFDAEWLIHHLGIDIRPIHFDSMVAHHLCDENSPHGLKPMVQTELMVEDWEGDAQEAMRASHLGTLPLEDVARYCATDCVATYRLTQRLESRLVEEQCDSIYYGLLQPLADLLVDVELRGLKVDQNLLTDLDRQVAEVLDGLEAKIRDLCGWGDGQRCPWRKDQQLKLNKQEAVWLWCVEDDPTGSINGPNSWRKVENEGQKLEEPNKLMYRREDVDQWAYYDGNEPELVETKLSPEEARALGLNPRSDSDVRQVLFGGNPWSLAPTGWTEKTGEPSLAADCLKELLGQKMAPTTQEFIKSLIHYNKLNKLHGTFINGLWQYVAPDGAVHSSYLFNTYGKDSDEEKADSPKTGRLSSSNPNMQNQPKSIRPLYVARDGYVFWEADYCCRYDTLVCMADGSTEFIGKLVNEQNPGPVMAVDSNGHVVPRVVTNWFKTNRSGRDFYKVSYEGCGNNGGAVVTQDHRVLTQRGWVAAQDLRDGEDCIATGLIDLSPYQRSALVGCMLGDGHIHHESGHFVMDHAHAQKEWVEWKGGIFSNMPGGVYSYDTSYRFSTQRHPLWFRERVRWYGENGERSLPRKEIQEAFSDLSLAIWYLDDGTCRQRQEHHRPHAELYTSAYSREDVEFLAGLLRQNGIDCSVNPHNGRGKVYWHIRINADNFAVMRQRIAKYTPPSMRYKLGVSSEEPLDDFDPLLYTPHSNNPVFWDRVVVEKTTGRRYRNRNGEWRVRPESKVYDLEVEGEHNFVTIGGTIHNCQLEVRTWAGLCKDPALLAIFERSARDPEFDFHAEMAAVYFDVPVTEVTPEQRQNSKAVTFGSGMYGGSVNVIVKWTGMDEAEAAVLLERMHRGFPVGQRWMREQVQHARTHGYVVSPLGRRRRLPEIHSRDDYVQAEAERQARNSVIQGLASDINNMAALRIAAFVRKNGLDAHIVNLVHDSILIEVSEDQVEDLGPIFQQIMEQEPYEGFGVPLQVDAEIHSHWAGELDVEKILNTGRVED